MHGGYAPGGPLAHREEQGTFNPKVAGSRPARPTWSAASFGLAPFLVGLQPVTTSAEVSPVGVLSGSVACSPAACPLPNDNMGAPVEAAQRGL